MENQQLRGMKGLYKDALEGKCLWEIAMRKDYFGSALHSHCRGQRFESAMLHQTLHGRTRITIFGYVFMVTISTKAEG